MSNHVIDATLLELLERGLPMARELVNADSPARRAAFREAFGHEELFELSNIMNALCSERSRALGSW